MLPTHLYVNINIIMFKIIPPLPYLLLCSRPKSHKRCNFYWLQIFLPRIWFADFQLRNHDLCFISELDQKIYVSKIIRFYNLQNLKKVHFYVNSNVIFLEVKHLIKSWKEYISLKHHFYKEINRLGNSAYNFQFFL